MSHLISELKGSVTASCVTPEGGAGTVGRGLHVEGCVRSAEEGGSRSVRTVVVCLPGKTAAKK